MGTLLKGANAQIWVDSANHLVVTDLDGANLRKAPRALTDSAAAILKSRCARGYGWVGRRGDVLADPGSGAITADALVFAVQANGCEDTSATQSCTSNELCAVPLYEANGHAEALHVKAFASWIDPAQIAAGNADATAPERRLILDLAEARLFPGPFALAEGKPWVCMLLHSGGCAVAVEKYADDTAIVVLDGSTAIKVEPGSLLSWVMSLDQHSKARELVAKGIGDGSLRVLAQTDGAWLLGRPAAAGGNALNGEASLLVRDGERVVPVTLSAPEKTGGSYHAWERATTSDDILLPAALDLVTHDSASATSSDWQLDDLGDVGDGRRILIASNSTAYLLSTARSGGGTMCTRRVQRSMLPTELAEIGCGPQSNSGADPIETVRALLSLSESGWRHRGCIVNPVISLFKRDCEPNASGR